MTMKKTIIGVCGKPCCGKTYLLERLAPKSSDDFMIVNCDKLAKEISALYKQDIEKMLGTSDSKIVANIIFSDKKKYKKFTKFIWNLLKLFLEQIVANSKCSTIILDAPLLLESGMEEMCDTVIRFDTKYEVRLERALGRGWNKEELDRRDSFFKKGTSAIFRNN